MISINPDAHSIREIDKGGLTKDMTWNVMPLKKYRTGWQKRDLLELKGDTKSKLFDPKKPVNSALPVRQRIDLFKFNYL